MIKFIINAISQGLAFSKAEARGTFALIIIVIVGITSFKIISQKISASESPEHKPSELASWVNEVESSFALKKVEPKKSISIQTPRKYTKEKVSVPVKPEKPPEVIVVEPVVFDLNSATVDEFKTVKGIGTVYSERIVKYREMLGGFASIDQLQEVYGLTDELIARIDESFEVRSKINPFNINSDSAKVLAKHPYLSYDMAWVIINYRKQNGDIANFEQLKRIKALDDSVLQKLRPYVE